jgi:preprotein translocase subunit SecE
MTTKIETHDSRLDVAKLALAGVVLAAGIVAFYYFAGQSLLLRVLGLLVVAAIAVAIASQTEKGRNAWEFMQEARNEVRKVVWPTRQETVQTTLVVIALVIVFAILMWLLDWLLFGAVRFLTGQGGGG